MAASDSVERSLINGDMFSAAAAGTLALTIAPQYAASREEVRGPGTFLPALTDELALLTPESILKTAVIEVVTE